MKGLFITGTDTHIGKTLVSSILCTSLHEAGFPVTYFKPIQTGTDEDCKTVEELAGFKHSEIQSPVYHFLEPISPNRAAKLNGRRIEIDAILKRFQQLNNQFTLVEGAGGVMVPLNEEHCMRDLISAMNIPALVVASTRLGTINHTLLTLRSLEQLKVKVLGVILNGTEDLGLKETIEEHSGVSVVTGIPMFPIVNREVIQSFCKQKLLGGLLSQIGNPS